MKRFVGWRGLVSAALLAFCSLAFGESDPPTPGAFHSPGHTHHDAAQTESQAQVLQIGSEAVPAFVKVISSPLSEIETKKNQYEGEEKPTLDRWLTGATIAMTLINLGMLVFTYRLWDLSRINYKKTLEQMSNSTHSQLRAYVGPESATYSVKENDNGDLVGQILIKIKNFGSTPAVNVSGETWHLIQHSKNVSGGSWIERSKHIDGHVFGMVEPSLILPMTIDIKDAFKISETSILARASIKYSDVFGKTYRRIFTFYLPRSSIKDGCNSADLHIDPKEKNEEQEIK